MSSRAVQKEYFPDLRDLLNKLLCCLKTLHKFGLIPTGKSQVSQLKIWPFLEIINIYGGKFPHFALSNHRVAGMREGTVMLSSYVSILKRACDSVWKKTSLINEK